MYTYSIIEFDKIDNARFAGAINPSGNTYKVFTTFAAKKGCNVLYDTKSRDGIDNYLHMECYSDKGPFLSEDDKVVLMLVNNFDGHCVCLVERYHYDYGDNKPEIKESFDKLI